MQTSSNRILSIIFLLFLLAAIPLTIGLLKQRQNLTQHAAPVLAPDTVIVKVGNQSILKGDIDANAINVYGSAEVDKASQTDILNSLIESDILEQTAATENAAPFQEVVVQRAQEEGIDESEAREEMIKENIILKDVKSAQAISIGFWSPTNTSALSADEKAKAEQQLSDGKLALPEIQSALEAGTENPLQIAESIIQKYPSLSPVLAVNGFIVSSLTDQEKTTAGDPSIIEFGDANLDPSVLSGLFQMNEGDIKTFLATETNNGGFVFKLVSKNVNSSYETYDDWLSNAINTLVTPIHPL